MSQWLEVASIVSTVDIDRPPDEVFAYATNPERFGEWQEGVVEGYIEGAVGLGARCVMTRRVGRAQRTSTSEVTEYDPPARWAIHGIDGPVRADVSVDVAPLDEGRRARVTIALDFHGRGFGRLIAPYVTNHARKEVPVSCQRLKAKLERLSGPS